MRSILKPPKKNEIYFIFSFFFLDFVLGLFVNVFLALDLFIVQIDFREFLRLIDCRNFIVGLGRGC